MALDSQGSLREQGVRLTRQRQILLDLIDQTGEHLDAAGARLPGRAGAGRGDLIAGEQVGDGGRAEPSARRIS